ncbi:hypothetical protein DYE50_02690 [Treponema ruminis]|uniref:Lipoprotein n=1 Tax=Treponema ruminis TaxID=744515 RepID=A0A7W8LND5_9SPIR|nr:hypothetical protein [Treponema ruminis]MBB5227283.1 hypothetical protein [Treponema ruminis]QSI01487.1 hypothetical protein DYE50_02690 [Treponema ruminis]
MKKASAFVLSLSILVLVLLSACNNSVEDMLDDYNGGFNKGYVTLTGENKAEEVLEPGDEGFSQRNLLFDSYTVYDVGTLNLAAPESCKSFSWVLTDPSIKHGDDVVEVMFFDGVSTTERKTKEYVVYIQDSGLQIGHTYYLTLSVIGKDGKTYTDLAQIFTVEFHIEVD